MMRPMTGAFRPEGKGAHLESILVDITVASALPAHYQLMYQVNASEQKMKITHAKDKHQEDGRVATDVHHNRQHAEGIEQQMAEARNGAGGVDAERATQQGHSLAQNRAWDQAAEDQEANADSQRHMQGHERTSVGQSAHRRAGNTESGAAFSKASGDVASRSSASQHAQNSSWHSAASNAKAGSFALGLESDVMTDKGHGGRHMKGSSSHKADGGGANIGFEGMGLGANGFNERGQSETQDDSQWNNDVNRQAHGMSLATSNMKSNAFNRGGAQGTASANASSNHTNVQRAQSGQQHSKVGFANEDEVFNSNATRDESDVSRSTAHQVMKSRRDAGGTGRAEHDELALQARNAAHWAAGASNMSRGQVHVAHGAGDGEAIINEYSYNFEREIKAEFREFAASNDIVADTHVASGLVANTQHDCKVTGSNAYVHFTIWSEEGAMVLPRPIVRPVPASSPVCAFVVYVHPVDRRFAVQRASLDQPWRDLQPGNQLGNNQLYEHVCRGLNDGCADAALVYSLTENALDANAMWELLEVVANTPKAAAALQGSLLACGFSQQRRFCERIETTLKQFEAQDYLGQVAKLKTAVEAADPRLLALGAAKVAKADELEVQILMKRLELEKERTKTLKAQQEFLNDKANADETVGLSVEEQIRIKRLELIKEKAKTLKAQQAHREGL